MRVFRKKLDATARVHARESVGGIEVVNVKQQGYDVFYYADADKNVAEIVKITWTLACMEHFCS